VHSSRWQHHDRLGQSCWRSTISILSEHLDAQFVHVLVNDLRRVDHQLILPAQNNAHDTDSVSQTTQLDYSEQVVNDHFCCRDSQRFSTGRTTPKIAHFRGGRSTPNYKWFHWPNPVSPQSHPDRFSSFCGAHERVTNKQTLRQRNEIRWYLVDFTQCTSNGKITASTQSATMWSNVRDERLSFLWLFHCSRMERRNTVNELECLGSRLDRRAFGSGCRCCAISDQLQLWRWFRLYWRRSWLHWFCLYFLNFLCSFSCFQRICTNNTYTQTPF